MLKTEVKASSITNLTDARYFAAWGVKWLGFNLDANAENYIQPQVMKAIKEWVDGVEIVGEFGLQTAENIQQAINLLELEAVQLGQFASLDLVKSLTEISIIKEIVIDKMTSEVALLEQMQNFAPYCQYFLLDFEKNGLTYKNLKNNEVLSFETVKKLCGKYAIILGIGCDSDKIETLLTELNPFGLSVKGGEEEKVGMKSFEELDEFFEAIEILV